MLDDVIGAYLDSLSEREFDAPFMALLRANGFEDIHLTHGPSEFGKDVIAKRFVDAGPQQFAFQTKAGSLGLSDWRAVRAQIDEARRNTLSHPSFDATLTRRAVLVTTGRLTGQAPIEVQNYKQQLEERGEEAFEVWDREHLLEMIVAAPELGLAGRAETELLGAIADIEAQQLTDRDLEYLSRSWISDPADASSVLRSAVIASVIANRLERRRRLDLACMTGLCLTRAAWASAHGTDPPAPSAELVADAGRVLFAHYAHSLYKSTASLPEDPRDFAYGEGTESGIFATYPVRCLRLAENLSLAALDLAGRDPVRAAEIGIYVADFVARHPGAVHPLSDRFAVSLLPITIVLAKSSQAAAAEFLERVVVWVCDRHETGELGLAGIGVAAVEEVQRLLGGPFEHVALRPRGLSYLATVLLDLMVVVGLDDLYRDAVNDFLAVRLAPLVTEVDDTLDQYLLNGDGVTVEVGIEYRDDWISSSEAPPAPHHARGPGLYYLNRLNRPWDHLAVSMVLRDRHFLTTLRQLRDEHTRLRSEP